MDSSASGPQAAIGALNQQLQSRTQRAWIISIRGLATAFAVTGIGLQIGVLTLSSRRNESSDPYDSYYYYYDYLWASPETFVFLGLSLVWNCVEFITLCVNKRGIHPGAHVGLDLIIWLGLLAAAITQLLIDYWNSTAIAAGTIKIVCWCVPVYLWCLCRHVPGIPK
jgi:hypothetical protein